MGMTPSPSAAALTVSELGLNKPTGLSKLIFAVASSGEQVHPASASHSVFRSSRGSFRFLPSFLSHLTPFSLSLSISSLSLSISLPRRLLQWTAPLAGSSSPNEEPLVTFSNLPIKSCDCPGCGFPRSRRAHNGHRAGRGCFLPAACIARVIRDAEPLPRRKGFLLRQPNPVPFAVHIEIEAADASRPPTDGREVTSRN